MLAHTHTHTVASTRAANLCVLTYWARVVRWALVPSKTHFRPCNFPHISHRQCALRTHIGGECLCFGASVRYAHSAIPCAMVWRSLSCSRAWLGAVNSKTHSAKHAHASFGKLASVYSSQRILLAEHSRLKHKTQTRTAHTHSALADTNTSPRTNCTRTYTRAQTMRKLSNSICIQ